MEKQHCSSALWCWQAQGRGGGSLLIASPEAQAGLTLCC